MIKFAEVSQENIVLQRHWFIDSSSVLLKMWDTTSDASIEWLDSIPIWVCFLDLLPHLWFVKCFHAIKNMLGNFMDANMSFLESGEMLVARILVSLNIWGV
jgi:hypothetical protein